MPSFQEMFEKRPGEPIQYKGNTLIVSDRFSLDGHSKFRLTFERCDSQLRQGVVLRVYGAGSILMNGEIAKGTICWQDTAPTSCDFEVVDGLDPIVVYNAWDWGDGVTHSRHHGAAMMLEELENGRR